jgi:kumamolisin
MTRVSHRRHVYAALASVTIVGLLVGVVLRTSAPGRSTPRLDASISSSPYGTEPLAVAIKTSVRIGPLPGTTRLRLTLALQTRKTAELDSLVAAGRQVTPATYDADYGPDATTTRQAERELRAAGLAVSAPRQAGVLDVSGTAAAIQRLFDVRIEQYAPKSGPHFYASLQRPHLGGALARAVSTVIGLDDYSRSTDAAMISQSLNGMPGGYSPTQVFDFYHFQPLMKAGLDGAGETVVFLEINKFQPSDLALYAKQFNLSPFNVTVRTSASFGSPGTDSGEPDLDIEIVHATAPDAKLIVYESDATSQGVMAAYAAMVSANPGAIISDSIGGCEAGGGAEVHATDSFLRHFAATGGSMFVAAGDSGAFTCQRTEPVTQWNPAKQSPNVLQPADDPYVTAVGGTSIFPGAGGTYGRELAWGNPVEQAGGGGGVSDFFKRPSWQTGPGVTNQYSNGKRQVPDVSSLADTNTGWDIATGGSFQLIGGTSTGAPLWAGLAALTDQSLKEHHRRTLGFLDPALYYFGSHAKSIPAPAFHDVTLGNNLYYPATVGWDFATGLGTPNAAALVDDFLAYEPKS